MKNQKTVAQEVVFRRPPPNSFVPRPKKESPKIAPKNIKTNEIKEKATVVTVQPMPTEKGGEKIGENKPPESEKKLTYIFIWKLILI